MRLAVAIKMKTTMIHQFQTLCPAEQLTKGSNSLQNNRKLRLTSGGRSKCIAVAGFRNFQIPVRGPKNAVNGELLMAQDVETVVRRSHSN